MSSFPARVVAILSSSVLVLAAPRSSRADETGDCIAAAEAAQPLRASSRLIESREKLRTCGRASCPRLVRADCTTWAAELDATMPTIVLVARDGEGHDVPGVRVALDGHAISEERRGVPVEIDPGTHVARFERESGSARELRFVATAGEKNHVVAVEFQSPPVVPTPLVRREPKRAPIPPLAFVFGGAALLTGASAAILGVSAKSDLDDLRGGCAPFCRESDLEAPRAKAIAADISLGVALVTATVGLWLVLSRPTERSPR